jgi:hypothetical protein
VTKESEKAEVVKNENTNSASFLLGGEISSKNEGMKLMQEENSDLFGIQFYDIETQKPYAHVLGSDISEIKVDFIKDRDYMMKMSYIKNGQRLIPNHNGHWSSPFSRSNNEPTDLHKVYYSSDIHINGISAPWINTHSYGGTYLEADRYHGVIEEFHIKEEHENLTINLKRMVFGLTINVEVHQPDVEIVHFSIDPWFGPVRKYSFETSGGKGSFEIPYMVLGFPNHTDQDKLKTEMDKAVLGEYQENIHLSIGVPDHHTLYFDGTITVTRNKMMTMDLIIEETGATSNSGVKITFEEEMLEKHIDLGQ